MSNICMINSNIIAIYILRLKYNDPELGEISCLHFHLFDTYIIYKKFENFDFLEKIYFCKIISFLAFKTVRTLGIHQIMHDTLLYFSIFGQNRVYGILKFFITCNIYFYPTYVKVLLDFLAY